MFIVTGLLAVLIAGGIQIMPEADRRDPTLVWVGPVFLTLAILGAVLSSLAIGRCCVVIYEALGAFADFSQRLFKLRSRPPKN
ncbi:MAG TPA: hypothetical protein VMV10_13415 [Pirellulales bacterium]|nr:hypothetical protein [Pirellulales bacterium]